MSALIMRREVTPQSLRALAQYLDSRGPGEEVSEGLRTLLDALECGHSVSIKIHNKSGGRGGPRCTHR